MIFEHIKPENYQNELDVSSEESNGEKDNFSPVLN